MKEHIYKLIVNPGSSERIYEVGMDTNNRTCNDSIRKITKGTNHYLGYSLDGRRLFIVPTSAPCEIVYSHTLDI